MSLVRVFRDGTFWDSSGRRSLRDTGGGSSRSDGSEGEAPRLHAELESPRPATKKPRGTKGESSVAEKGVAEEETETEG